MIVGNVMWSPSNSVSFHENVISSGTQERIRKSFWIQRSYEIHAIFLLYSNVFEKFGKFTDWDTIQSTMSDQRRGETNNWLRGEASLSREQHTDGKTPKWSLVGSQTPGSSQPVNSSCPHQQTGEADSSLEVAKRTPQLEMRWRDSTRKSGKLPEK